LDNCTASHVFPFSVTKKGFFKMHSFAWWPTLIVVAVATFTDLRSRRIPNWLVLPFLAAGITVSGWLEGWHGIAQSMMGLGLGILLFGVLFWMGGMGAGDVKLAAAIGAWIGPMQLFFALVVTGIVGGIMAVGWAIAGGFLSDLLKGSGNLVFGRKKGETAPGEELTLSNPKTRKMPYAPAIALGTLISFFAR
jgi:prepilin peptidase CpaA